MDFVANKTPIEEVIREDAFGGTYFRGTYSGINGDLYKNPWKEFNQLKILIRSIIAQIIMM